MKSKPPFLFISQKRNGTTLTDTAADRRRPPTPQKHRPLGAPSTPPTANHHKTPGRTPQILEKPCAPFRGYAILIGIPACPYKSFHKALGASRAALSRYSVVLSDNTVYSMRDTWKRQAALMYPAKSRAAAYTPPVRAYPTVFLSTTIPS